MSFDFEEQNSMKHLIGPLCGFTEGVWSNSTIMNFTIHENVLIETQIAIEKKNISFLLFQLSEFNVGADPKLECVLRVIANQLLFDERSNWSTL